jgi:rod shape-determining protein MreD
MKKFLLLIGFSLLAILLQIVVAPWLTIQSIKPDFILILVLFVAIMQGRIYGQLFGFGIGLVVDSIGIGSFLGLSALSKTIAGFIAGYLKKKRNRLNKFAYYSIACFIVLVHFIIFYLINFKNSGYGVQYILLRYVLPEVVYTSVLFILLDYYLPINVDEL